MVNIEPRDFIRADYLKFDKVDNQYFVKNKVYGDRFLALKQ